MVDEVVVKAVTAAVGDVTADQVRQVLTAVEAIHSGAAVGTIVEDPKTGAVAHRVDEDGVTFWSVTAPDGAYWRDMQPTLKGWTVLRQAKIERAAK